MLQKGKSRADPKETQKIIAHKSGIIRRRAGIFYCHIFDILGVLMVQATAAQVST